MSTLFVRRYHTIICTLPLAGWWRDTYAGSVVART